MNSQIVLEQNSMQTVYIYMIVLIVVFFPLIPTNKTQSSRTAGVAEEGLACQSDIAKAVLWLDRIAKAWKTSTSPS